MESTTALSLPMMLLIIYLIFKFNNVLTIATKVINKTVTIADHSIDTYADDVNINLAKKKIEQFDELSALDFIPTSLDINNLLNGKIIQPTTAPKAIRVPRARA